MKRILMVNTVATGSHGRLMTDLAATLDGAEFQSLCAYGRGKAPSMPSVRVGSQAGVFAHVALTRAMDLHARGSSRATSRLIAEVSAYAPDTLHLHNVHGYYLNAGTLFSHIKKTRLRTVWTLHDCWAFTGHCSHYMHIGCDRWKNGCYRCPLKREYPASLIRDASRVNYRWKQEAFLGVRDLTLSVPSKWLYDQVADSFLKGYRRVLIPNGVDLGLFVPRRDETVRAAHGVLPGQKMLLAVASPFDRRKGFSDALRVAERVRERARLVMVGLSQKQLKGLPSFVTGVARTESQEALVGLYGAADCLINPTYQDTYPTVNMEAMACGTPVAAYGSGGCVEQMTAPFGVAVTPGDDGALADVAITLASRKESLSRGCRAHAEARFDRADALRAYRSLYE